MHTRTPENNKTTKDNQTTPSCNLYDIYKSISSRQKLKYHRLSQHPHDLLNLSRNFVNKLMHLFDIHNTSFNSNTEPD